MVSTARFGKQSRLVVALLLFGVAVASLATSSRAKADDGPIVVTGSFTPTLLPPGTTPEQYHAAVQLYAEPGFRRLYAYTGGFLAGYDLDTFKPRGAAFQQTGLTIPTASAVYPDPNSGMLFVGYLPTGVGGGVSLTQYDSTPAGVKQVSTLDLMAADPNTASLMAQKAIVGIYRAPGTDAMWLLAEPIHGQQAESAALAGPPGVTVVELHLGAPGTTPKVQWAVSLPSCTLAMHSIFPAALGYVASQKALYFGCANQAGYKNDSTLGSSQARGVGRLQLGSNPADGPTPNRSATNFQVFGRDGNFSTSDSFFDPGGGRMLFTTNIKGETAFGFDANSNAYVGGISIGGNQVIQAAVDPVIGRFYGITTSFGMAVSDIRTTPLSQGLQLPTFKEGPAKVDDGIATSTMAYDPVTRRMFLKYYKTLAFQVAVDRSAPYVEPTPPDPDAATVDVDEEPGQTASTYSAGVQGFGVFARQAGGVGNLFVNTTTEDPGQFGVAPGTREVRAGYVDFLRMANAEASANAISLDRDTGTQSDLDKTAPNQPPPDNPAPGTLPDLPKPPDAPQGTPVDPNAPVVGWPTTPAACFDFGGNAQKATSSGVTVTCDADGSSGAADASSKQVTIGGVTVDSGTVLSTTNLDHAKGVRATVTSTAKGIDVLGGILHIGSVSLTASTVAHGRPGTAASKFEPDVQGVFVKGTKICDTKCATDQVAAQINSLLAGRVRVSFPQPDKASLASKGGYQALVRRDPMELLDDVILNDQSPDRLEVPAMIVTVFEDDSLSSRTIYEFAGVGAESHYGISLLGGGDDLTPVDTGSSGGPVFGGLGGGALPLPGGVPSITPDTPSTGGQAGPADAGGTNPIQATGRLIWNGLRGALRLLPIWAVLLVPIYLSARRWLLYQRSSLHPGGAR